MRAYAAVIVLGCATAACTDEPADRHDPAAYANVPNVDPEIDSFLRDYLRQLAMFADDTLDYEVRGGRVSVRGAVDNEEERTELSRRIRALPGVRDVDVRDIRIGGE